MRRKRTAKVRIFIQPVGVILIRQSRYLRAPVTEFSRWKEEFASHLDYSSIASAKSWHFGPGVHIQRTEIIMEHISTRNRKHSEAQNEGIRRKQSAEIHTNL